MRRFAGIDLGHEPVPDETTICKFRHMLETHKLGRTLFERVNEHLAACGIAVSGGTIVDATIIAAPSSTKNAGRRAIRRCTRPARASSGIRHEAACWRGQPQQADPLGRNYRSQRA
jgi:IS5 family transposase